MTHKPPMRLASSLLMALPVLVRKPNYVSDVIRSEDLRLALPLLLRSVKKEVGALEMSLKILLGL